MHGTYPQNTTVVTEKGKTMSDYIKREDAKDAVINVVGWESIANYVDEMSKHFCTKDNEYYDALMDAEDAIDDLPPADVAPVRHGRWEKNDYLFLDTLYRCSVCGEEFYLENGTPQENQYYYCPNCGARMDVKE